VSETVEIRFKNNPAIGVVDSIDSDLLSVTWHCHYRGYVMYTRRVNQKTINTLIHRLIMARVMDRELTKDEVIDHIDNNPLNNTRANLRLATRTQNNRNRGPAKKSKSGYKGVCWDKSCSKWITQIVVDRKVKHLGRYDDPKEGARAYNAAAIKYHGEFAWLNIIPEDDA
jgi:hypothetical protein